MRVVVSRPYIHDAGMSGWEMRYGNSGKSVKTDRIRADDNQRIMLQVEGDVRNQPHE